MAITGNFTDFSLPELLHFLDQGKKTGLLQIQFLSEDANHSRKQVYYIWLHQGRVITAADTLDRNNLISMITQRGWISERVISRVTQISSGSINSPLGIFLKSQGMLQSEQLKLLFNAQVLRPICSLFQIKDAQFTFDAIAVLPLSEMTGLSMSGTEVILMSLRSLKDWQALADKLPERTSGLSSLMAKKPQMHLTAQEWQVWEFVNGQISLQDIAQHLRISVETVQQIAFRLIVVGLTEENFLVASSPTSQMPEPNPTVKVAEMVPESTEKPSVSQSFLKNLVGFLRSK
jgi:hypothetical protein